MGRVDVVTSTLGKALGGASGGFTSGRKEIVDMLRQRSRPYLFSNTVAPAIVGAAIKAFEMLSATTERRDRLEKNTEHFRTAMTEAGFAIRPGVHPIVPIMLGEARLAATMADAMADEPLGCAGAKTGLFEGSEVPQEATRHPATIQCITVLMGQS